MSNEVQSNQAPQVDQLQTIQPTQIPQEPQEPALPIGKIIFAIIIVISVIAGICASSDDGPRTKASDVGGKMGFAEAQVAYQSGYRKMSDEELNATARRIASKFTFGEGDGTFQDFVGAYEAGYRVGWDSARSP
jgi:hypothetical protein